MFERYSDEELFFSYIRVVNPEYQGAPKLDRVIWKHNIGLIGELKEYTYSTILQFDGEKYIEIGNRNRDIKEDESQIGFSIKPVHIIDFKVPASKYCTGTFSRSRAYEAFYQHRHEFDRDYKAFKEARQNKQRVKK